MTSGPSNPLAPPKRERNNTAGHINYKSCVESLLLMKGEINWPGRFRLINFRSYGKTDTVIEVFTKFDNLIV